MELERTQFTFIAEIKTKVRQAQYEALKAVNVKLIDLYWEIGKSIAEKQSESWGKAIVPTLSKELQIEFPGMSGFSVSNLWQMAQFYTEYQGIENLQPLVGEISWTKHLSIMSKCKDNLERQFYILATKKFGWTKNVLIHQIENKTYEKYLLNQLKDIKAGKRVGTIDETTGHPFVQGMTDIMHLVDETDLKNVAKYLAEQKPGAPKALDPPPAPEEIAASVEAPDPDILFPFQIDAVGRLNP